MLHRHDHSELLAFIEGELSDQEAKSLRARLTQEPQVLAIIERMREDRLALQSGSVVELPRDFLSDLEPLIARPMLIEPVMESDNSRIVRPGESRRQFRRRHRRVRWNRLAAAAAILVAVGSASWFAVSGMMSRSATDNFIVQDFPSEESAGAPIIRSTSPADMVHHYRPIPTDSLDRYAFSSDPRSAIETPVQVNSAPVVVAAEFILVVHVEPIADAEALLVTAAAALSQDTAVVRNFSYAEAQRIANDWRLAGADDPMASRSTMRPHSTAASRASKNEINALADHLRQRVTQQSVRPREMSPTTDDSFSAQLSGPKSHAPSLEQQLEFSSRGATHTIAVRVTGLHDFVEQFALAGHQVSLRMLRRDDASRDSVLLLNPLSSWLQEVPDVRQAIDRLDALSPDSRVFVPVRIIVD